MQMVCTVPAKSLHKKIDMVVNNPAGNGIIPLHKLLPLILFMLFCPCASPLTFNYPSFSSSTPTISLEGVADFDSNQIILASPEKYWNVGRATYREPFLLRENATGKLADFTTNFTFIIHSGPACGMVFFIAPNGSVLNSELGGMRRLGLPVKELGNTSTTQHPFVAVEFDILSNRDPPTWDPVGDHVGIDINSLNSIVTKPWNGGIDEGKQNNASISYDSLSKTLSVTFTSFQSNTNGTNVNEVQVINNLSYMVDLKQYLPDWVIVGFSASTIDTVPAVHKIVSWNFNSTALSPVASPGNANIGLLTGLGVGGCVILVGGLGLLWFIFRRWKGVGEGETKLMDEELEQGTGPRKFSYRELALATRDFEEGEKLGEGGFGAVYRGFVIGMKSHVAVKRISAGSKQGMKEYASEVRIISRLRHRNLVQLIGWCHEKEELLLVYEFMPNGSLDYHLFKEKSMLTWQIRYNIAQGLASGIFYLHEAWEQCVLHRDIKSSNVMLDSNFNVKLGDFGLARLVDHGKESLTTNVAGTRGYMAMEYVTTGKASKESDVYSFGVVALEIACGRKPINLNLESSQVEMVKWVWELYGEGKVIQAADPKLSGHFDEEQMECLMIVGLWCAHPDFRFRPTIQQAIKVLNFEAALPILPLKLPVATYFAPPIPHHSTHLLQQNSSPSTTFSLSSTDTTSSERGQKQCQSIVTARIPHNSAQLVEQNSSPSTNP